MKGKSLRRMNVLSIYSYRIETELKVPMEKIFKDITENNSLARTSNSFPVVQDNSIQYQLCFFPFVSNEAQCALHINIAPDYLHKLRSTSTLEVNIPQMNVTVNATVSVPAELPGSNSALRHNFLELKQFQARSFSFPTTVIDRPNITVAKFQNLLCMDKLKELQHSQRGELVIKVILDCFQ